MQSISYSPGLTNAVRSLKQLDSQQLAQLFKDSNWFKAFSLTSDEGKTAMKLFASAPSDYIRKSGSLDPWG